MQKADLRIRLLHLSRQFPLRILDRRKKILYSGETRKYESETEERKT